jgi:general secretion pathway protein G
MVGAPASRKSGFTLIELIVTLSIIALLVSIIAPHYTGRILRAEEAVLRENLLLLRDALDKHYSDAGRYPDALAELVSKRYLRALPRDPLTRTTDSWIVVPPADREKGGVYDVHSAASGTGSDGKPYAQW